MPRRGSISKRDVLPDPLYNSKLVTKLVNNVMYDGKKGVAQTIVYDAFKMIEEKLGQNALEVFQAALDNIKPELEVKARRVGGSTYQVPMEVRPERQQTLALRWLINYSRPWLRDWLPRSWTPRTAWAAPSRRRKRLTVWPRPTRLSPITVIDFRAIA